MAGDRECSRGGGWLNDCLLWRRGIKGGQAERGMGVHRRGEGGTWWVSGPKHCPAGRDQKVVVASSERQSGGFKQPVK